MKKRIVLSGLAALLIFNLVAGPLAAQENPPEAGAAAAPSDQIMAAAKRLFTGIADGDVAVVAQNTSMRYARKLDAAKLRPAPTGPKLTTTFSGDVALIRSSDKDAVVEAKIFVPEGSDIPASEVSRVRVYMVKEGGDWKASAANKKEAQADATMSGGWYHAAFFTFCPNLGLVFVPNHFSGELKCQEVAKCGGL